MNYIKHLNGVFGQFAKDNRLNPTHISLYVALFQIWNKNFFKDEFYINREEVMAFSKIGSKSTYHRCIKELNHWNYLLYTPSHNPFKGSRIKMFNFETSTGQVLYQSHTNIETSSGTYKQTYTNLKKQYKQKGFKNSNSELKNRTKYATTVPYRDNLKTTTDKNYNEPL